MAGMINAAGGTIRRMKEMDEMTSLPPAPKPAPVSRGAVKKADPAADMAPMPPPPARTLGSAMKRMLGFGAKKK